MRTKKHPKKRSHNGSLNPLQKGVMVCSGGIALISIWQGCSLIAQTDWIVPGGVFLGMAVAGVVGAVSLSLHNVDTLATQPSHTTIPSPPSLTFAALPENMAKIIPGRSISEKLESHPRKKLRKN